MGQDLNREQETNVAPAEGVTDALPRMVSIAQVARPLL